MKKLAVVLMAVVMVASLSVVAQADALNGYDWQHLNRDEKAGVLYGFTEGFTVMAEVSGYDGFRLSIKEARSISYIIDGEYEENFPRWTPLFEVIMEGGF